MSLVAFLSGGKLGKPEGQGKMLLPPHMRTVESAAGCEVSTSEAKKLVSDQLGL